MARESVLFGLMASSQKLNEYLEIPAKDFAGLGVFNPFVGLDAHMFVDPALLRTTDTLEFKGSKQKLTDHFVRVLKLLQASKYAGDIAWREARDRLIFKELQGIAIGYGLHRGNGNGIGSQLAQQIAETAKEILDLGIEDPVVFELVCLFQEDLGADRLSDMVISIIKQDIFDYTDRMVRELKVKDVYIKEVKNSAGRVYKFIKNPDGKTPLLLLPEDILKDLPMALSHDDIGHVVYFNKELRESVSALILGDASKSLKDLTKKEYRDVLMTADHITMAIESYKKTAPEKYNFKSDPSGQFSWSDEGKEIASKFPLTITKKELKTIDDVNDIVGQIIAQFKRNIENNELYELLYKEPIAKLKPKNERFAQRLFYSVADSYCEANGLVLSREPNAGNGPVDFKISSDYSTQVLVELKLSSGHVRSGFEKQLPEYEKNERASKSFLVILKVTESDAQIKAVKNMRELAIDDKKHVPEIVVIDALPRPSASIPKKKKQIY